MKELKVTCPTCKKTFNYYDSKSRPFCSERCRLTDLGLWLTESYAVPVTKLSEDEIQTLEHILNEKNDQAEGDKENNQSRGREDDSEE